MLKFFLKEKHTGETTFNLLFNKLEGDYVCGANIASNNMMHEAPHHGPATKPSLRVFTKNFWAQLENNMVQHHLLHLILYNKSNK